LYDQVVRGLLLVLLATAALAQRKPFFKIDGVSPRAGGAAELLEGFCPGQVEVSEEVKCRETLNETDGWDCPPTATMATRGHFLSPKSDDILLALRACEPHSAHFGSTALFTREGGAWKFLWRKPGLITNRCHRMPLRSGRQILVCELDEGFPGVTSMALYLVDVLHELDVPRDYYHDDAIFSAAEMIPCGGPADVIGEQITRAYIERVEFYPRPSGDGENMTIFAQYGKTAMTAEMIAACSGPATKPYRIDFLFDGRAYKVAAHSSRALQVFGSH
jgi:hypothetical protein